MYMYTRNGTTKVTKREMITFKTSFVNKVKPLFNLLSNYIKNAFISMYDLHLTCTNTFIFIFRETQAL